MRKNIYNLPSDNSLYYFVGIDKARFRKPVEPGDQLILEVELERRIRDVWKFKGTASVDGEVVAIDGKSLRCSRDGATGKSAIHLVSAFATKNRLLLGQVSCEEKSNEITAVPRLLRLLDLRGCIVSIDAMGCQKAIA